MATSLPSSLAGLFDDRSDQRAATDLLCELLHADSALRLEVDGHRVDLPAALEELLRRAVEHLRRGDDIRRSLGVVPAAVMLQPVVDLADGSVVGHEALSDLPSRGLLSAHDWFRDGAQLRLSEEFELAWLELAVAELEHLPEQTYLSVNLSPLVALSARLTGILEGLPGERLVIELTEHVAVDDYASLDTAMDLLRSRGARLAIDDAGAGFASLHHILRLRPEIVKLDNSLIRHIHADPARRALVQALSTFAREIGATTVAEGVEAEEEAEALRTLGVDHGQGWLFGVPRPRESA